MTTAQKQRRRQIADHARPNSIKQTAMTFNVTPTYVRQVINAVKGHPRNAEARAKARQKRDAKIVHLAEQGGTHQSIAREMGCAISLVSMVARDVIRRKRMERAA